MLRRYITWVKNQPLPSLLITDISESTQYNAGSTCSNQNRWSLRLKVTDIPVRRKSRSKSGPSTKLQKSQQ